MAKLTGDRIYDRGKAGGLVVVDTLIRHRVTRHNEGTATVHEARFLVRWASSGTLYAFDEDVQREILLDCSPKQALTDPATITRIADELGVWKLVE